MGENWESRLRLGNYLKVRHSVAWKSEASMGRHYSDQDPLEDEISSYPK